MNTSPPKSSSGSLPTTSLGTGYESQIVDEITANSPAAKPIFYTLRENVMNYHTVPSFATDIPVRLGHIPMPCSTTRALGKMKPRWWMRTMCWGDFTVSYPGVDFSVTAGTSCTFLPIKRNSGPSPPKRSCFPSSIPGVVTGGTKYWLRMTYQNVVTFDVEGSRRTGKVLLLP